MSTNLDYKVISQSGADKGKIFAACQYVTDAFVIVRRWPGRAALIKYHGRTVWNNKLDKDGLVMNNLDWFEVSKKMVEERIELHNKQRAEKYAATLKKVQNWANEKSGMGDSTAGLVMG